MVAPATSVDDIINRISTQTASEEDRTAFHELLVLGLATTYQGDGAKETKYQGEPMSMVVAEFLNRDYERNKKPKKSDRLTTTLATSGNFEDVVSTLSEKAATFPTFPDRLEKDDILEKTLEKQDNNQIEIVIFYIRKGCSYIEIEGETGIDRRRASEMSAEFVADAKKIAES